MQKIFNFCGTVEDYMGSFDKMEVPIPVCCDKCKCKKFYRWGTYPRFIIVEKSENEILINRIACSYCKKTISFLPDFCIPRFVYSMDFVMIILQMIICEGKRYSEELRELIYFYKKRFLLNINTFIVFLREKNLFDFPLDEKEKAIKIFVALSSLHREKKLLSSFFQVTTKHFMAK